MDTRRPRLRPERFVRRTGLSTRWHAADVTSRPAPDLDPVIDFRALEQLMDSGRRVVLADVRWYLDGRDGHAAYLERHLRGAVFVDLDEALARHDLPATDGRHPLPDPVAFAATMERLGIDDRTTVVAYDDTGGMTAGRLVVMLRMLGRDAALLDGGLDAAVADGLPTASGPGDVPAGAGSFTPSAWPASRLADADAVVAAIDAGGIVIDARSPERFSGEVALIDPRPGHIPGARNAPWDAVLDPVTRRMLPSDRLRSHFAACGISDDTEVIAHCGSGVSTCINLLALERAGLPAGRLFVASFSGWSADPHRPVATTITP